MPSKAAGASSPAATVQVAVAVWLAITSRTAEWRTGSNGSRPKELSPTGTPST